jgi:ubiquitin-protein ligase E3 C
MTSQFDLASFIQTVVYEEEKLIADGEDESHPAEAMEEDEDGIAVRRPTQSAKVSLSKRQMAFISPRLGVLNNSSSLFVSPPGISLTMAGSPLCDSL